MKINYTLLVIVMVLFGASGIANDGLFSSEARQSIKKERLTGTKELPSYFEFKSGKEIMAQDAIIWLKSNFFQNPSYDFTLIGTENDQLGHLHYRYQQTFNGYPIEGAMYIVHTKAGKVYSMNGDAFNKHVFPTSAPMLPAAAFNHAKQEFPAVTYKWELQSEEDQLKQETGNITATYLPQGKLVYVARNGNFYGKDFRLAYKYNMYAQVPLKRSIIYIDAITGEKIFEKELVHTADVTGTANTAYSGTQTITSDSFGGGFRLNESGRGNGIFTYDMQNGTNYGNAIDVVSATSNWNLTGNNQYALDAHFGAEMTYDYFLNEHGRNSIDGAGFALYSYVHYDVNYANAFWDGSRMTYGDGNGTWSALTSLDIAGHEISHGLTTFTAGLVYQDESGALNESFSDIFGAAVEFYALGYSNGDWLMGEDIGGALRSLSNPNAYGDPDTYFGTNWAPLGGPDNGGVHTNSGVQNYWFYLLTEGGSGTNDAADVFNVSGLGITKSSAIAFRNLTVYLTPNSTFADARFYAIQSATDLYGPCTNEVIQTTNAWYAVNVGEEYAPVFETDFTPSITGGCVSPFAVDFSAFSASSGTGTYTWDFGDGNTGTGQNPTHVYGTTGTYTVTLIEDGGACGIDTAIYVDLISAGQLNAPSVNNESLCSAGSMTLNASGTGLLEWFDAPTGGNSLTTGNSYTTPVLSNTTSYWVESQTGVVPDSVGPKDNTFNTGGYFTGNQSLIFDAYQDFTLVSVWVDANGAGNRDIELYDDQSNLVASTTINIPNGQSRITLNFNVPAGTNYTITSPSPDLYRNDAGAAYPYTLANVCAITNSTAGASGYYYFFYDWEIMTTPCSSPRVEVIAAIAADPVGTNDQICGTGVANPSAVGSGVGTLHWYDDAGGTNEVGTGSPFTTPTISTTTTYYVSEELPGALNNVGPIDNSFGGGGQFNGDQHLIFDVASNVTLESVLVYAGASGNRTIELRNSGGTVLHDTVINIPAGQQRIYLNFPLTPGTGYQLGTLNGSNPDLFRNNSGPSYPYDLPGQVTIQNSSAGTDYYYFFYDWEIREASCFTNLVAVDAIVTNQLDATISPTTSICESDAASNLNAVDGGGTWTGTGITNSANGTFDPATAGPGTHTITYTIPGTCGDTDTEDIIVLQQMDATISAAGPFCSADNSINLTGADNGGVWSGTGITSASNGTFDPATAGAGTHIITYTHSGACGDVDTETITINAQQDATINPTGGFCPADAATNLSAADAGGTWSGVGITNTSNGTFDPGVAGNGVHQIIYTLTGTCADADTVMITVNSSLDATISAAGPFCSADAPSTLTGADAGGTWSGTGITNAGAGTFDPSVAGVGSHTITYTLTGTCGDTDTETIVVTQQSDATISAAGPFCSADGSVNLTGADAGGAWTGSGITNGTMGTFDPASAGVGSHIITYTITGACGASDTETIIVNQQSDATISAAGPYCSQDAAVNMAAVDAGGLWSGTGITDGNAGTFDPSVSGTGSHVITYTISGACGDIGTITVDVNQQMDATITAAGPFCADDAAFNLSANDAGGTWSGNGITDANAGTFDPVTSGTGIHTITYTIGGACGDIQTEDVLVNPLPNATIVGSTQLCLGANPENLSVPAPGNGTFSGPGMTGNSFDPNVAGLGTHTITYTVTNGNGCTNTDDHIIEVVNCDGVNEHSQMISVYPNPSNGQFTIQVIGSSLDNAQMTIQDATGKLVMIQSLNGQDNAIIKTEQLSTGVYFLQLSNDGAIETHKLVVR